MNTYLKLPAAVPTNDTLTISTVGITMWIATVANVRRNH